MYDNCINPRNKFNMISHFDNTFLVRYSYLQGHKKHTNKWWKEVLQDSPHCSWFWLYIRDIAIHWNSDRNLGQGRMWHHGSAVELVLEMEVCVCRLTLPVGRQLQWGALCGDSWCLYLQRWKCNNLYCLLSVKIHTSSIAVWFCCM